VRASRLRRPSAPSRQRAFAAALLFAGLLLFTWPFVRVPPLHVVPAFLHLIGAWALVIAGLGLLARAVGRAPPRDPRG
jgi:hypothetical protein